MMMMTTAAAAVVVMVVVVVVVFMIVMVLLMIMLLVGDTVVGVDGNTVAIVLEVVGGIGSTSVDDKDDDGKDVDDDDDDDDAMVSGSVSSMESYAKATAVRKPVPLETKLIKLDMEEVTRSRNLIEVEGDSYKLCPPKETKENKILRTVVYRTPAVETVLAATKEELQLGPVAKTKVCKWWGFGLEMWLFAIFEDIERIPYQIEMEDEKTLNVVVEGRKPNCYICGERGHMKTKCPLYEFTQPRQEKVQTEEERIVDHTEEIKERQKCETEKTKEKNENEATNPKKRRKNKSKERSTENKEEIKKPETNNVQEEEERTVKDVKYKGGLIKYENCEQMERKVERLEEIIRVKMPEKCAEK
uniref:CCHC-type domain-containing protein n=1 Tax=Octopus bimaculoides TaxID=37653 RepID=A0A0L8ICM9_OCTBM